jgi:FkbM family methyltransferase
MLLTGHNNTRRVWFDIGVAGHSDFQVDVADADDLLVVALEPTPSSFHKFRRYVESRPWRNRWSLVQRACIGPGDERQEVVMHTHAMPECNSLLPATSRSDVVVHKGRCIGDTSKPATVKTTTLEPLLQQALALVRRVQLLKIDIQGLESPCLEGAGDALRSVDNIFLEVQDLPRDHASMMYVDAATRKGPIHVGDFDERLGRLGFERQYCEENSAAVREFNCLYTQRGRPPLWVTGRPLRLRRTHAHAVEYNMSVAPDFRWARWVAPLLTAATAGALDARLPTRPNPCPSRSDPRCRDAR